MALTLPTNITGNYLKTGNSPRVFVKIPSSNLYLGTADKTIDSTSYTDTIKGTGSLSQEIDKYAGVGSVSNVTIWRLELGNKLSFATEATISPKDQGSYEGAGRIASFGNAGETYLSIRSETNGSFETPHVAVGQRKTTSDEGTSFLVFRGFLQFDVPSALTSCEQATISLTGTSNKSDTDFNVNVYKGQWTVYATGLMFNDFDGWAANSGTYTGTLLNETWSSYMYDSATNNIILNEEGRKWIEDNAGSTVKFMLVSSLDTAYTEPSGNEYLLFETSSAQLNIRYNTYDLDNKEATIYLGYETVPTATSDMLQLWTGVIDDYSFSERAMGLTLRQNNFKKNMVITENIMTDDTFSDLHGELNGKPYPVAFGRANTAISGTHDKYIGYDSTIGGASGLQEYYKFPVIDTGDADYNYPMQILIGVYDLDRTLTGYPAIWDESLRGFCRVWCTVSSDIDDGDYQYVQLTPLQRVTQELATSTTNYEEDFFGIAASMIPTGVYDYDDTLTPEGAYNGGNATLQGANAYAEYSFGNEGAGGEIDKTEVVFDLTDNHGAPGTNRVTVKLIEKPQKNIAEESNGVTTDAGVLSQFTSSSADFVGDGVSADDMLIITSGLNEGRYRVISRDSATVLTTEKMAYTQSNQSYIVTQQASTLFTQTLIYDTGQRIVDITTLDTGGTLGWDLHDKLVRIEYDYDSGTAESFVISNLQIRIFAYPDKKPRHIYFDARGREDDASGTITGTASQLLENPSHIIEDIARNEMGLSASGIDTSAFDTAATELSDWEMAFQFLERRDSMDIIGDLAKQSKSRVWWDEQDRLTMKIFDETDAFPNANANTPSIPGNLDIFNSAAASTDGEFTQHPIYDADSFEIKPVSLNDVYNDFVLHYKENYATGDFEKTLYITNGDGVSGDVETNINSTYLDNVSLSDTETALKTLTSDSYNEIGAKNTWEYEAWAIRDEATATKLLEFYIIRFTKRRRICTFMAGQDAIGTEIGDFVNIRHPRISELYGTATQNIKKWQVISKNHDLERHSIRIKAIEV